MMNQVVYRIATAADVETLVTMRIAFLEEISKRSADDGALRGALRSYFARAVPTGEFVAYVAEVEGRIVATSGLVFHQAPPSMKNLAGREGYIMNMFTVAEWRGQGIATALLQRLVDHVRQTDCCRISLHAMPEAKSIYGKAGFRLTDSEMWLDLRTG
jgi:GNAT superfamily N-acetyltransferase